MLSSRLGMKVNNKPNHLLKIITAHRKLKFEIAFALFLLCFVPNIWADVIINVLAINGAPEKKETPIRFVLPPDVKANDIVDTDGLSVEYDVNEGAYVAQGAVSLEPKATKTFRIKVKDIWKLTPQDVDTIKKEINEAHDKLGKLGDDSKAAILKQQLLERLDFVVSQQNSSANSVEKRIDSFRIYRDRLDGIKHEALSVDYWRSDPNEAKFKEKLVRMVIEIENPPTESKRMIEEKYFLPLEVKPEYIVNREDFDIKFDEEKRKPYLFKEEEFESGQKRRYEIGIRDVWHVEEKDMEYLNQRSVYANNFLKESRFEKTAQYLFDRCQIKLNSIIESQKVQREILEHISTYRQNVSLFEGARQDVEDLEKLVAIFRDELEKTKVRNVLQKVRSLKNVSDVSDSLFKTKPKMNKTWEMVGWVVLFVGIYTIIHFGIWALRSSGKKKK
jgi:phage shock protein A